MTGLFLDVDGVLNCIRTRERAPSGVIGIEPGKVDILRQIFDLNNDTIVVLTTTWRTEWDPDTGGTTPDGTYLANALARAGITPFDKITYDGHRRGAGIVEFIKGHEDIDRILILDDEPFDFRMEGLLPFWLRTSLNTGGGLQQRHVRQAARMLKEQKGRDDMFDRIERQKAHLR